MSDELAIVRTLPQRERPASELERLLLGGLLESTDPRGLLDRSGLSPEDIGDRALRVAVDLVQRRAQRKQPTNAIAIWQAGRAAQLFGDSDLQWLQGLQAGAVVTDAEWLSLAEERRRTLRTRAIGQALRGLAAECESGTLTTSRAVDQLEAMRLTFLRDYKANRTAEADPAEMIDAWAARVAAGKPLLTPTHAKPFDDAFGGLPPKLGIILGSPGVGKTALEGGLILSQLRAGMRVGLIGLEDGYRWLTRRAMAESLGMKLSAISSAPLGPDEWLRVSEAGAELSKLFRNLLVFRWGKKARDLVQLSLAWRLNEGVQTIWLDNATAIDHSANVARGAREDAFFQAVGKSADALRDVAEDHEFPIVVLAHTKREYAEKRRNKPPLLEDIADASAWEKNARLVIGCWRRHGEFRATSLKVTEAGAHITVAFEMHTEAALVDVHNGAVIDLAKEQREEAATRQAKGEESAVEKRLRMATLTTEMRARLKPPLKAEKPDEPEPQLPLLDVPGSEKT